MFVFRHRESNPGLLGESQLSWPLDHAGIAETLSFHFLTLTHSVHFTMKGVGFCLICTTISNNNKILSCRAFTWHLYKGDQFCTKPKGRVHQFSLFKQFFACSVAKLGSQISFGSTAAIASFFIQRFRPFVKHYFDIFAALIFTVLLYGQWFPHDFL